MTITVRPLASSRWHCKRECDDAWHDARVAKTLLLQSVDGGNCDLTVERRSPQHSVLEPCDVAERLTIFRKEKRRAILVDQPREHHHVTHRRKALETFDVT